MHKVKLLVASALVAVLVAGPVLAQEAEDSMAATPAAPTAEAPKMEATATKAGKHHKKHAKKHAKKHHKKGAEAAPAAEPAMEPAQ